MILHHFISTSLHQAILGVWKHKLRIVVSFIVRIP